MSNSVGGFKNRFLMAFLSVAVASLTKKLLFPPRPADAVRSPNAIAKDFEGTYADILKSLMQGNELEKLSVFIVQRVRETGKRKAYLVDSKTAEAGMATCLRESMEGFLKSSDPLLTYPMKASESAAIAEKFVPPCVETVFATAK